MTPSGVPRNAWQLQAIFLSTIVDHGLVQHTLNETPHPIQAVPFATLSSSPYACIASNLPWYRRRLSLPFSSCESSPSSRIVLRTGLMADFLQGVQETSSCAT
jgi:hypothetical protein